MKRYNGLIIILISFGIGSVVLALTDSGELAAAAMLAFIFVVYGIMLTIASRWDRYKEKETTG